MGYIIVFRNCHREPFISVDNHDFKDEYYSYESAKEAADEIIEQEGKDSPWYFDYQIYKEVNS